MRRRRRAEGRRARNHAAPEQPQARIINLFEALKRSLKEPGGAVANEAASSTTTAAEEPMGIKKAPTKKTAREKKATG